jgi:transcriptional regulator with XRE-family HTH domain
MAHVVLTPADAQGNYPAVDTLRTLLARDILSKRRELGLSQAELARRAGIRPETLNRLEQAKHTASVSTVEKIDQALRFVEAQQGKQPGASGSRRSKRGSTKKA